LPKQLFLKVLPKQCAQLIAKKSQIFVLLMVMRAQFWKISKMRVWIEFLFFSLTHGRKHVIINAALLMMNL